MGGLAGCGAGRCAPRAPAPAWLSLPRRRGFGFAMHMPGRPGCGRGCLTALARGAARRRESIPHGPAARSARGRRGALSHPPAEKRGRNKKRKKKKKKKCIINEFKKKNRQGRGRWEGGEAKGAHGRVRGRTGTEQNRTPAKRKGGVGERRQEKKNGPNERPGGDEKKKKKKKKKKEFM